MNKQSFLDNYVEVLFSQFTQFFNIYVVVCAAFISPASRINEVNSELLSFEF